MDVVCIVKVLKSMVGYLQGFKEELKQWDVSFWAERLREAKFNITDEELRPYFALPNVLKGLFQVWHLFGSVDPLFLICLIMLLLPGAAYHGCVLLFIVAHISCLQSLCCH